MNNNVQLWDALTGRLKRTLPLYAPLQVASVKVCFSSDGKLLAGGSINDVMDNTIQLWDIQTGKRIRTLRGHQYGITGLAFSADGTSLASSSVDGTIKIWRIH